MPPQKPPDEQQSPNVDPLHVLLLVPHKPSVETLPFPLPEQVPNPGRQLAPQWLSLPPQKPLEEQESRNADPRRVLPEPSGPQRPSVLTLPLPMSGQWPKSGWQPGPQWAGVAPQKLLDEQQSPYVEPVQLYCVVLPQEPSGDGPGGRRGGALQLS